ncbi:hypothetical protein D9M72_472090 [compost metagenome]
MRQQVIGGIAVFLGDDLSQIAGKFGGRLVGVEFGLVARVEDIHPDHAVRPVEKIGRGLDGYAEHAGDDRHGDRFGVRLEQLDFAVAFEAIDQGVRQMLDIRSQLFDLP